MRIEGGKEELASALYVHTYMYINMKIFTLLAKFKINLLAYFQA